MTIRDRRGQYLSTLCFKELHCSHKFGTADTGTTFYLTEWLPIRVDSLFSHFGKIVQRDLKMKNRTQSVLTRLHDKHKIPLSCYQDRFTNPTL